MRLKPSEAIKFSRPLWPHQIEDLDRFALQPEVALFWRMGTGKTTEAIALLRAQYQKASCVRPTLIISPVATLENWKEEFQRNSPEKVFSEVAIAYGEKKKRLSVIESGYQIIITNPESLDMKEVAVALGSQNYHSIVVDEVHRFKDPRSKRLKALLGLTGRAKQKIIMTGTPILNSYLDLWAQFMILDGGKTFGREFRHFRAKYFIDKNASWVGPGRFPLWVPKPGIEKELPALIEAKCSRRHEDDVLKLPPRVFKKAYVEMSPEQAKAYKEMEDELVASVFKGECAASNALSQVIRLLQILTGYIPINSGESLEDVKWFFSENPRIKRLRELVEEIAPNNKIIIWACFTPEYVMIQNMLDELRIGFAELTGRIGDKQEHINTFRNDPKCRVMIANAKAGGVGVNLVEAAYSIYYSRGYSLGDYEQSAARNRRGGSEIHSTIVQIDMVVKDTLDEVVLEALSRKENFAATVLDKLKRR